MNPELVKEKNDIRTHLFKKFAINRKQKYTMKYVRFFMACISLITVVTGIKAQTEYTDVEPSANAEQFLLATSGKNTLQSGQLSVNIPLFNLEGKGVNVPLSISFNPAGITHKSQASTIGLGWSLMAGGVITQSIRGFNDQIYSSSEDVEWQYNSDYLQRKYQDEMNNTGINVVDMALSHISGVDGEPDDFNYSFLGYSGDIYYIHDDDDDIAGILYPDKSFILEKTTEGFKITGSDGTEYFFEVKDYRNLSNTNWFLSEIRTLKGGVVTFQYEADYYYDPYNKTVSSYGVVKSNRIKRIDYDYGYVIFNAGSRADKSYSDNSTVAKKINSIELYNKNGTLIKGYEFNNNSYFCSGQWYDVKLKLEGIREYNQNGEHMPPYEFEYEYFLPQYNNTTGFILPKNTWAYNPYPLASVMRNLYGDLNPFMQCNPDPSTGNCIPTIVGHITSVDNIDGTTVNNYLSITKLKFPTGGSEEYEYEPHLYGFVGRSEDYKGFTSYYLMGKRLSKKTTTDTYGNSQIIEYKYLLHDNDYNTVAKSSGVLVNPSIHTSTMYKTIIENSVATGYIGLPVSTLEPQNSLSGSHIYYTEVEEIYKSSTGEENGKKINYFHRMYADPGVNYIYLNYGPSGNTLTQIPNTICGKQQYPPNDVDISGLSDQNYTYLAYPLGRFNHSDYLAGKLKKEVLLDNNGNIVRKIENEYYNVGAFEKQKYGLLVKKFDDSDTVLLTNANRYLICQTNINYGVNPLIGSTITNYYPNDSIKENQEFTYTYNSKLLKSITTTQSKGETITKENIYLEDIGFQTETNLQDQALTLKKMKEKNIVGTPIQTTVKNGSQYVGGNYTTFKELSNGAIVVDSVFSLGIKLGASVSNPVVNTEGEVERNSGFIADQTITEYDENINPATIIGKGGVAETIVWGYGGQYPIAKIVNYTNSQIENNSLLVSQLELLDNFNVIGESDRASLLSCNQAIRNYLPDDVMITTFTYDPLVGVTSQTDANGRTTYYEYDDFKRLYKVTDHFGNIIKMYEYNFGN